MLRTRLGIPAGSSDLQGFQPNQVFGLGGVATTAARNPEGTAVCLKMISW